MHGYIEMNVLIYHECECKLVQLWEEGGLVESNKCTLNVYSFYPAIPLSGLSPTAIIT